MPSAWLGPQTNQCRQTRPFTGPWESCDSIRQEHALVAWCKRERERLQMQREMLQSGRFRIFEKDDSDQQRDISNQHIEQIAANISELDRIIMADYEAKSV